MVESGRVVGILRRNDLVRALAEGHRDAPISGAMCRDCTAVKDTDSLTQTLETMRQRDCASVPVVADGPIIGLLTLENVSEVLMVNAALSHGHSQWNDPRP